MLAVVVAVVMRVVPLFSLKVKGNEMVPLMAVVCGGWVCGGLLAYWWWWAINTVASMGMELCVPFKPKGIERKPGTLGHLPLKFLYFLTPGQFYW